jgi:hypothetical protein
VSHKFDDQWLCERLLVPDSQTNADALVSLYKDKTLVESPSPVEFLYTVVPDTRAATRGDASVEKNLQEQFGLSLDQVASYYREELLGRVRTFWSFNHCWALKPWAEHFLSRPIGRTIVLHFDAHDDLASPMIGVTNVKGVFTAPVGGSTLDLKDGSTIEEFVLRGFVGIGSFIAPALHAVWELDIVHVAQDHRAVPEELEILLETVPETTFTGCRIHRPSVRLALPSHDPKFRYTRTSDVSLALAQAAGRDMVLDIDLDYFCNAFDNKRPDPGAVCTGETTRLMDDLWRVLKASKVVPSLVTLALSPGFFPSDDWPTAVPRLREIISDL